MNKFLFDGPDFDSDDNGDARLVNPHVSSRRRAQGSGVYDKLNIRGQLEIDHPHISDEHVALSGLEAAKNAAMSAVNAIKPERPFSIHDLPSGAAGLADDRARALGRDRDNNA